MIQRKKGAFLNGGFPTVSNNYKKYEQSLKIEDVEYYCNTSSFFLYISYVYTADLCKKINELWNDTDRKSQYAQFVTRTINNAYEYMHKAFESFVSYCNTKEDEEYVRRLMHHMTFLIAPYTEHQAQVLFNVIKPFYGLSETEKGNSKKFKQTEVIAYTIATRRFFVMAENSMKATLNKYHKEYPNIVNIIQSKELSVGLGMINDIYYKMTEKLKDIDLSLNDKCTAAQRGVIKEVTNRLFYKAVAESLKHNTI